MLKNIKDQKKNSYNKPISSILRKFDITELNPMQEKAREVIKSNSDVVIFTDSTYVKNGITDWIKKWEKNGWKSSNKKPIKNKDLWIKLNNFCQKNKVTWKWVKGHSNNKYNDLADELATQAIKN